MKTEQNNLCPCGSGIIYEECCINKQAERVRAFLNEHILKQQEQYNTFGDVRPIISTEVKGYRFVTINDGIAYSNRWLTFHDFLLDYIKHLLDKNWFVEQLSRPFEEQHPIIQWYNHLREVQGKNQRDKDGFYSLLRDGIISEYILLAYDLYLLQHSGKLQDEILSRLLYPDQFRGARYELLVAAAFIRAGFNIEYEDETDITKKHPEFIAPHKWTKLIVSVEAKSKNRAFSKIESNGVDRPKIKHLLKNAAKKQTEYPLIVLVELDLPPDNPHTPPSWIAEVEQEVNRIIEEYGGNSPFDLVIFTNISHRYGEAEQPAPYWYIHPVQPKSSRIPEEIVDILVQAIEQYGNVPSSFPEDRRY